MYLFIYTIYVNRYKNIYISPYLYLQLLPQSLLSYTKPGMCIVWKTFPGGPLIMERLF